MNGSDLGLLSVARLPGELVLLLTAMDVSADRDRSVERETGVGEAVVLFGSVGSRFGGFFELPLSGAMTFPTARR